MAADVLVAELVRTMCTGGAPRELATTCGPGRVRTLRDLRQALVADLLGSPRHALSQLEAQAGDAGATATRLRIALAVVETLAETQDLTRFAMRLSAEPSTIAAGAYAICLEGAFPRTVPSPGATLDPRSSSDALSAAAHVLARLAPEREALTVSSPDLSRDEHLARVALAALAELEGQNLTGAGDLPVDPARLEKATALVRALRTEGRVFAETKTSPALDASARLGTAWLTVVARALELVASSDRHAAVGTVAALRRDASTIAREPERVAPLIGALGSGDWLQIAKESANLAGSVRPSLRPTASAFSAFELATDFARARNDDERRRVLERKLLGLGAWSRPLLFDVQVGSLVVSDGGYHLAGDALLGWNAGSWGVAGRGHSRAYDMSHDQVVDETTGGGASLEGFWASGDTARLRFDGRFVAGAELFDTDTTEGAEGAEFVSQTSILAHASLLAGIRWQSESSAAGLWLGGGPQYEWYDPLVVTSDARIQLTDDEKLAARGIARLRAETPLASRVLVARLRIDGALYSLTRSIASIETGGGGGVTSDESHESSLQLELRLRAFLDLEAARLFDFVPGLVGGFDSVRQSTNGASTGTLVPAIGLGVRRESF